MALSLSNLVRAKSDKPPRIVIYGVPGIGKTSLAAEFPDPIFIQTEEGAGNLELTTFADEPLTSVGRGRRGDRAAADRRPQVPDGGSRQPRLARADALGGRPASATSGPSIEDAGFGKGYVELDAAWRYFLGRISAAPRPARHDGDHAGARGDQDASPIPSATATTATACACTSAPPRWWSRTPTSSAS